MRDGSIDSDTRCDAMSRDQSVAMPGRYVARAWTVKERKQTGSGSLRPDGACGRPWLLLPVSHEMQWIVQPVLYPFLPLKENKQKENWTASVVRNGRLRKEPKTDCVLIIVAAVP
jgi:hypothetical protein